MTREARVGEAAAREKMMAARREIEAVIAQSQKDQAAAEAAADVKLIAMRSEIEVVRQQAETCKREAATSRALAARVVETANVEAAAVRCNEAGSLSLSAFFTNPGKAELELLLPQVSCHPILSVDDSHIECTLDCPLISH